MNLSAAIIVGKFVLQRGGSGKMLFRDLAGPLYRHRDQAYGEETGGGSHSQADMGSHGERTKAAHDDRRMHTVQYLLDRALQWDHA